MARKMDMVGKSRSIMSITRGLDRFRLTVGRMGKFRMCPSHHQRSLNQKLSQHHDHWKGLRHLSNKMPLQWRSNLKRSRRRNNLPRPWYQKLHPLRNMKKSRHLNNKLQLPPKSQSHSKFLKPRFSKKALRRRNKPLRWQE